MKKMLQLFVVGIFVLSGLGAGAFSQDIKSSQFQDEILDQYQEIMTENAILPIGNIPIPDNPLYIQVAQSFIPTKGTLTKLEIYIGKNSTATYPLKVSIRKVLTEDDLTVIDINPNSVPTETYDWVEINIDDTTLNPGETYYIVTLTENVTDNFYVWGANNISGSYPFGCAWISLDGGDSWTNESTSSYPDSHNANINQNPRFDETLTWDMCFRTYGLDNQAPNDPTIDGPSKGKTNVDLTFTIMASDPDGNDVYYCIDWGDGTPVETIGPYPSGFDTTATHKWSEKGDYLIKVKAKDIYNAESNWVNFDISIPRSKSYIFDLVIRLNNFPMILKIIQLLHNL
jgi:hypothetical protein